MTTFTERSPKAIVTGHDLSASYSLSHRLYLARHYHYRDIDIEKLIATTDSSSIYHEHMLGSPNSWKGPQNHNENGDPGSPFSWGPQNFMTLGEDSRLLSLKQQRIRSDMGGENVDVWRYMLSE